jgi:hypothetical protein
MRATESTPGHPVWSPAMTDDLPFTERRRWLTAAARTLVVEKDTSNDANTRQDQ